MGIRFRRSIKLGPGVRLNIGKKSAGLSFGVKGLRYSVSTSGRKTVSAGIPGTGLSHVSSLSGRRDTTRLKGSSTQPARQSTSQGDIMSRLPKPGLFSPGEEKSFYDGIQNYLRGNFEAAFLKFTQSSAKDTKNASDDLFAGLSAAKIGKTEAAIEFLEKVVASEVELPDKMLAKYVPPLQFDLKFSVSITDKVIVQVEFDNLGATLLLAELYQQSGRKDEAIGVLQQLSESFGNNTALILSLCELYDQQGDYESIIDTVPDFDPEDDVTLACLIYKGKALLDQRLFTVAQETLGKALKRTSNKNPELLKEARYYRGLAYEAAGQKSRAKAEFERVYAQDRDFKDVAPRLGLN